MAKDDKVKVRVLVDCELGKCNTVAEVLASEVKQLQKQGLVDSHPDAVKAAEQ